LNEPLSILFEDDHCLALDKPAGQFTQGTWAPAGEVTLETAVRQYLGPADPGAVYVGIVHRLDRPTSGVIIWAKTIKAARRLSTQFDTRRVLKEYWAIVELQRSASNLSEAPVETLAPGAIGGEQVWKDWLARLDRSGRASAVSEGTPGAREALTTLSFADAVALPGGCAWLRLWPYTGRTHQLRIQAARRGMPILGDAMYGSARQVHMPQGITLHARSLVLKHPSSSRDMTLLAPCPSWWKDEGIILPDIPGLPHE
jgi:23S rRNA pseudouridine1911/1915/1917 synthase